VDGHTLERNTLTQASPVDEPCAWLNERFVLGEQMMHYLYDSMWVNVELVEVPACLVVGPSVSAFTHQLHLSIQDAYVGFQHMRSTQLLVLRSADGALLCSGGANG
jgi:hypothetical protein